MFIKKSFSRLVSSLMLLMIMLLPCSAFAQVKEITAIQWYQKGYDYQMNEKDYDNAIFAYNKAIELNPQLAEAYNNRGIIYNSKGQYDLAIIDYNKVIELNPQNAKTYYIKALICNLSERNSEAIEAYTLFLRYALPTDPKIETAKYRIRLLGGTVD